MVPATQYAWRQERRA